MKNLDGYFRYDGVNLIRTKSTNPRAKVGDVVGTSHSGGYLTFTHQYKRYYVHRAIWYLCNGPIPEGYQIDHINGDRTDNRLENLRLCTPTGNAQNSKKMSSNSTGIKNVSRKMIGKVPYWRVQVRGAHTTYDRVFKCLDEASKVAAKVREELHGPFANHT